MNILMHRLAQCCLHGIACRRMWDVLITYIGHGWHLFFTFKAEIVRLSVEIRCVLDKISGIFITLIWYRYRKKNGDDCGHRPVLNLNCFSNVLSVCLITPIRLQIESTVPLLFAWIMYYIVVGQTIWSPVEPSQEVCTMHIYTHNSNSTCNAH